MAWWLDRHQVEVEVEVDRHQVEVEVAWLAGSLARWPAGPLAR